MKATRRKLTTDFKAQVAIEALREQEPQVVLWKRFGLQPIMISKWKQEFVSRSSKIFETQPSERTFSYILQSMPGK